MRHEILFLLLMGRELMGKPTWGPERTQDVEEARGARTAVPRAFPGVRILLDDTTGEER